MATRKWTYWHKVTEGNDDDYKPGQIVGFNEQREEAFILDHENKGFKVKARFKYLGKLPYNLESENKDEAIRQMQEKGWIPNE